MTVQLQKQKRSKILDQLLDSLGPDYGKLQSQVDACFEQGRKEGFNDMEIGDLVRSKMKEHYSGRTIRRVLPDTAKHTEKAREQKDFADKLSANERPILEANKVSIEPIIEAEQQIVTSVKKPEHQTEQLSRALSAPPGPREIQGIPNIDPADYELDHITEYDTAMHIQIIQYLHEVKTELIRTSDDDEKEYIELQKENKTLKKEIEKLKKENNEFMLTLANDALEFGQIVKENDALKKEIELLHNRAKA